MTMYTYTLCECFWEQESVRQPEIALLLYSNWDLLKGFV